MCVRVRSLTHTSTLCSRKEGFFLFFSLLHPLTAATTRHRHPGSSSFASQPEHSGRMATRRQRGPSLFHESGHLCRGIRKITNKKSARDRPEFSSSLSFLLLGTIFTRTHTHTPSGAAEEKKCCAHTHTRTNFSSNFEEKIRLFPVSFESWKTLFAETLFFPSFNCH